MKTAFERLLCRYCWLPFYLYSLDISTKKILRFCEKNLNSSVSIESVLLKTSKFNNAYNNHNKIFQHSLSFLQNLIRTS